MWVRKLVLLRKLRRERLQPEGCGYLLRLCQRRLCSCQATSGLRLLALVTAASRSATNTLCPCAHIGRGNFLKQWSTLLSQKGERYGTVTERTQSNPTEILLCPWLSDDIGMDCSEHSVSLPLVRTMKKLTLFLAGLLLGLFFGRFYPLAHAPLQYPRPNYPEHGNYAPDAEDDSSPCGGVAKLQPLYP
jgi:hypothetical protein